LVQCSTVSEVPVKTAARDAEAFCQRINANGVDSACCKGFKPRINPGFGIERR